MANERINTMKIRTVSVFLSIFSTLALASPPALAQRGGGYGGGHGGGMGGYGGMPSGIQPGGHVGSTPSMGSSRLPAPRTDTERPTGSDRAAGGGKAPGEMLQQNTRLSENLGKLLPAGTDLQAAASGFKNLGEFVAAVHVSNNLGIPFVDLKARMMTGDNLGDAIRALRPDTDSQIEARKARAQAEDEIGKG